MVNSKNAPRWDLESVFPGGSASKEYLEFRIGIKKDLEAAEKEIDQLKNDTSEANFGAWGIFVLKIQEIYKHIYHAGSFAGCLVSQDVNDSEGHKIDAEISSLGARLGSIMTGIEEFALQLQDDTWKKFIDRDGLQELEFFLNQLRDRARDKMKPEFEKLVLDLSVDGYHGWNRIYDKMAGDIRVDFPVGGKPKTISIGQLVPQMDSPDRGVRKMAFEKMTEAWEQRAELAALILNSQAGFRLALYKNRKWDSILFEPLKNARIEKATLDSMWSAISKKSSQFKRYIEARKKLLKIDKYAWYDQTTSVGKLDRTFAYDEAADFIIEHIGGFSKEMGEFSKMAIDNHWIEAEDRAGKAAGGYCTGLPMIKQTRIFMTYTDTFGNLSTLAHELGHSYHSWVLRDKPIFASRYPMTLAETASTFNELRVKDAAMGLATKPEEQLMLLDQKLQDGFTMMCNIYARYLFDCSFYEERKQGMVSRARLDEIMIEAQRKAYAGTMDDELGWHPLFWASKLHFFLTGQPFYNFPYTFGFLFAVGIYDRAIKEGPAFSDAYKALLADTGSMTAEQVASKHMGVDLTKEDYWSDAVDRVLNDIDKFVKLADKIG